MQNALPDMATDDCLSSKLDLNLLVIFDTVMEERHVTRASQRLGLTQSAVSNALNRLRKIFDDLLFIKTAKGVEPTKHAIEIWQEVHPAVAQLQRTIRPEEFIPSTTALEYRVSMGDLASVLLTPYLLDCMQKAAPKASLNFAQYSPNLTSELLARGALDFAIGIEAPRMSVLDSIALWNEEYVIAGRRDHPNLQKPLTIEDLCKLPQMSVNQSGSPDFISPIDRTLGEKGLTRPISMTVNQFLVAAAVMRDSDLLAVLPKALVTGCAYINWLESQPLPIKLQDATLHLAWHRRNSARQSMMWFRDRVVEATAAMNGSLEKMKVQLVA